MIVKQHIQSKLKVKKCGHDLFYADIVSFFVTRKFQKTGNKIFRKYVTYDNIKSHNKPGLHPRSRSYIFGKNTEGRREFRLAPHPLVF